MTENSRAAEEDRVLSNGVQEEVCVFLCETFESTLLPATLVSGRSIHALVVWRHG